VSALAAAVAAHAGSGVDPDELAALCEGTPYALRLSWAAGRPDGSFDAAFVRGDGEGAPLVVFPTATDSPAEAATTDPLRSRRLQRLVLEVRDHLRATLPDHMVPSAFVTLEALPLSPNGKVDRAGLPDARGERESAFVAPRTPAETVIAGVWAEVLGLARVGVHEDFFELGGHSLLATQVVTRLRALFDVEVPLRAIFESPTVAALAEAVASQPGGRPGALPSARPSGALRTQLERRRRHRAPRKP
jgi:acyl carrier protein